MSFIALEFDIDHAQRYLGNLITNDFPFIYALTLTRIAQQAKVAVGDEARRNMNLSTEFIPRNIRIKSAKKSDIKKFGIAESKVFTGQKLDGWIGLQEYGGTKKPHRGSGKDKGASLSIPGKSLRQTGYKKKSGAVKNKFGVKRLLNGYIATRGKKKGQKVTARRQAFIQKMSGIPVVLRRVGKKRYPIEILYIFADFAKIKPTWGFIKAVKTTVNNDFKREFLKNWRERVG